MSMGIAMPHIKPSMRTLSEERILRAVANGGEDNLILHDLSLLINSYVRECSDLIAAGKNPEAILQQAPSCPVEKIALSMAAAALKVRRNIDLTTP